VCAESNQRERSGWRSSYVINRNKHKGVWNLTWIPFQSKSPKGLFHLGKTQLS